MCSFKEIAKNIKYSISLSFDILERPHGIVVRPNEVRWSPIADRRPLF